MNFFWNWESDKRIERKEESGKGREGESELKKG